MASNRNERKRFQKDGPKRRRRARRDLPEGGYSQWPSGYKNQRRVKLIPTIDREER